MIINQQKIVQKLYIIKSKKANKPKKNSSAKNYFVFKNHSGYLKTFCVCT